MAAKITFANPVFPPGYRKMLPVLVVELHLWVIKCTDILNNSYMSLNLIVQHVIQAHTYMKSTSNIFAKNAMAKR